MAASNPSATVAQNNLQGTQLLWTDTGTYNTLVSRNLTIYDCNGVVLVGPISLGATLTYLYNITADGFYQFVATIVDNTGTFTSTVDYVATGFYTVAYLNAFNNSTCGAKENQCNLDIAENFYNAALRMNLASNFVAAQALILAANIYANLES